MPATAHSSDRLAFLRNWIGEFVRGRAATHTARRVCTDLFNKEWTVDTSLPSRFMAGGQSFESRCASIRVSSLLRASARNSASSRSFSVRTGQPQLRPNILATASSESPRSCKLVAIRATKTWIRTAILPTRCDGIRCANVVPQ